MEGSYDIAIVGGGIVGLATARELSMRHASLKIAVFEKETELAAHQTGHNSGVIHSGIYYKPGSLKAKLCTEGKRMLWAYCEEKGIPYRSVGKLIVATNDAEVARLQDVYQRGLQNDPDAGFELIGPEKIKAIEPNCVGLQAVKSPKTGIVDYGLVSRTYADDAKTNGAEIFTGAGVEGISRDGGTNVLKTVRGDFSAKYVVSCAGLHADRVARMTGSEPSPKIIPFRGDYYVMKPGRESIVHGNIYPVPDPAFPFLGVHFTPRMNGEMWLGPNAVLAFAREGYSFFTINPRDLAETLTYAGFWKLAAKYPQIGYSEMYRDLSKTAFVAECQKFVPSLTAADVVKGPAGVRAQALDDQGGMVDDFVFSGSENVIHVRNAPSPAATSSMAIGKYITEHLEKEFVLA
ncbi:MAG TPA: L-2-hydroxyglutarate oxidase [Candidatus Dormibacteraeota bacterium]|nr:L-2-hydroxyglutarate oxidase [Candidatus Dormibacteraeota bacterium]